MYLRDWLARGQAGWRASHASGLFREIKTMNYPESTNKAIANLLAQLEYEEKRIRMISREEAIKEATEQRNELVEEINNTVKEIANEIATLRHDLRWLLAIPRIYRSLRERFTRLAPHRKY
jgi:hypothetical protein